MSQKTLLIGALAAIIGLGLVMMMLPEGGSEPELEEAAGPNTASGLRPDDRALVARGLQVYTQYCATCHGAGLEGQPNWKQRGPGGRLPAPPHDASGHTWHHPDAQLIALTKFGLAAMVPNYQTDMPVYDGVLSDEEIIAVLSYIKSTWPADIRARHDQINANFKASQE
ncbi:MAG: cytochrome c [Sphingomonadales bacterium]